MSESTVPARWAVITEAVKLAEVKDVIEAADYIIIQRRATGIVNNGPLDKLDKALERLRRAQVPGPPDVDPELLPYKPKPFA
jgi:hypothetical protein